MKYVMIQHSYPICFPDNIDHCSFKDVGNITSAGFVGINQNKKVIVFGKSSSLNGMVPEEDDQFILQMFLKGYSELDLSNMTMLMAFDVLENRKDKL